MNATTIRQALKIQQKIDHLTRQRDTLLNGANGNGAEPVPRQKRQMSEATKNKIRAAQRRRWKELRKATK